MSQEYAVKVTQLPPRLRQVHELLMLAESEKRIAMKMGISPHTVHDHVKELYRRAGANTRAEYLLKAIGQSPPRVGAQPTTSSPRVSLSLLRRLVRQVTLLENRRSKLFDRITEVAQHLKRT